MCYIYIYIYQVKKVTLTFQDPFFLKKLTPRIKWRWENSKKERISTIKKFQFWILPYQLFGDVDQMLERLLCMWEVPGLIPCISIKLYFYLYFFIRFLYLKLFFTRFFLGHTPQKTLLFANNCGNFSWLFFHCGSVASSEEIGWT